MAKAKYELIIKCTECLKTITKCPKCGFGYYENQQICCGVNIHHHKRCPDIRRKHEKPSSTL